MIKLLVTVMAAAVGVRVNVMGVHGGGVVDRTSETVLLKGRLQGQECGFYFFHFEIGVCVSFIQE